MGSVRACGIVAVLFFLVRGGWGEGGAGGVGALVLLRWWCCGAVGGWDGTVVVGIVDGAVEGGDKMLLVGCQMDRRSEGVKPIVYLLVVLSYLVLSCVLSCVVLSNRAYNSLHCNACQEFEFESQTSVGEEMCVSICVPGVLKDKADLQRGWGVEPRGEDVSARERLRRFYYVYNRDKVCFGVLAWVSILWLCP